MPEILAGVTWTLMEGAQRWEDGDLPEDNMTRRTAMAFHKFIVSVVRDRRALLIVAALGFCGCVVVGPRAGA